MTPDDDLSARALALWEASAERWTRLVRDGCDVYRDTHNTPAFLAMLPPVAGLAGLDIGCGEGANTRELARRGARMLAIDGSATFLKYAQETESQNPLGIIYAYADAVALPFPDCRFDFATAFMSLMDVPDFAGALREAYRVLRPGGFLQFSILHPCFKTPQRRVLRDPDRNVLGIEIGGYFDTSPRTERWIFEKAPAEERVAPFEFVEFHHTLAEWLNALVGTGFVFEHLSEPCATEREARENPYIADTRVAPLFLHIRARKPT
jgi:SAM-dependent methyltransferase